MASGLKLWAPGNVLASADVNDYLSKQSVMRFSTVAARDAAVTVPVAGQVAYTDDYKETYIYKGSWISLVPRTIATTAPQVKNNSTTLADYTGGGGATHQLTLEANSTYVFDLGYEYMGAGSGAGGPDIKFRHSYGGTFSNSRLMISYIYYNATSGSNTRLDSVAFLNSDIAPGALTTNDLLPFLGQAWVKTTNGGNLKLQFAQNSAAVSDTTLNFAVWRVWKTA